MSQNITHARLLEVIHYDPNSGVFTWKARLSQRTKIGDEAGCVCGRHGYRLIRIDNVLYRANILAWLYMTGEWPPHLIDHKNLRRADDRWENLRAATYSQNFQNGGTRKDNTSGHKGVTWDARRGLWMAQICVLGKRMNLGRHSSVEGAAHAYRMAAVKHFGEFARVA
jgi:hypothetical protein